MIRIWLPSSETVMKIKTRLYASFVVTSVLVVALSVLILFLSINLDAELYKSSVANQMVQDTTELNSLMNQYLRLHNDRSLNQWRFKHDSLESALKRHKNDYALDEVIGHLNLLNEYFSKLVEENNVKRKLFEQKSLSPSINRITKTEKMLIDQISVNSQEILQTMFMLASEADARIQEIQHKSNYIVLMFAILIVIVSMITSLVSVHRISEPLNRLINGTKRLEEENFHYQIPYAPKGNLFGSSDEITDLTRAFNKMAWQLELSFTGLQDKISEKEDAQKALLESEEKYRTLFEKESDAIFIYDPDSTNIIDANAATSELYGYKKDELIGMSVLKLSAEIEESSSVIDKIRVDGEINVPERLHCKKDGTIFPVDVTGYSFKLNQKDVMFAVSKDITARRNSEKQIESSLKEKETLLYEIHHRVKNNMTVISSLLKLQSNTIEDEHTKEALKDSQNRVYAMSAVHETLHSSKNLSQIDLKVYLSKITTSIFQAYSVDHGKVKLNNDVEESPISINQAYPIGLIINELISNSLKYAFPDERKGEITVRMKKLNQELRLIVMDDGVGMPDRFDRKHTNSLGLKLVHTLVENQLDGLIDVETKNGTKFTIKFNIDT